MYCQNKIVHTVQSGDSLYKLSRQYKTTVTELILGNPGVNPYNLQVGMKLTICPGEGYEQPDGSEGMEEGGAGGNPPSNAVNNLIWDMRKAWLNHVYTTRMYLMSVDADAKDQQQAEEQALEAADEIASVFAEFLPINVTRQLRNLLTEHVEMTGEIIRTLKSGNMENYDELIKNWYGNANQIATLLGSQNPYFGGRETRNLLLNHLDLVREEIEHQINGEYGQSVNTFRDIVTQAIEMADYFARGLMAR